MNLNERIRTSVKVVDEILRGSREYRMRNYLKMHRESESRESNGTFKLFNPSPMEFHLLVKKRKSVYNDIKVSD